MNLAAPARMPQSVFDTASHGAELIGELALGLFIGGALLFVLVMALVICAAIRGPGEIDERRWVVLGGLVLPVVVLTVVLVFGLAIGRSLSHAAHEGSTRIQIVGKRWGWEIRYLPADGADPIVLANELHLPGGGAADLSLEASDVIHSFWVPALAGKVDMIPGRTNRLVVHPTREGIWRGQCAEYCGSQHAQMALEVVVESPSEFQAW